MTNLIFSHTEIVAHNTQSFYFMPEKPVRYEAGQFIELRIPSQQDIQKRWFTLSSSPTEQHIAITTRMSPLNHSSYKQLLHNLKPGDTLVASDPMGDFVLPLDTAIPLVFIAAGLGITPARSMVKWLIDNKQERTTQLLYAVSNPDDFAFRDLFDTATMRTTYIATSADQTWQGHTGRLDAVRIKELTNYGNDTLMYVSGPELMVETLTKELIKSGVNPTRIISDYFLGYEAV